MTIRVNRSDRPAPETITVHEIGGYVPVSEFATNDRAKMGPDKLPQDAVIEYAPIGGAKHPQVGDRYVFILTRAPGETTGSLFFAMGDTFGRFSLSSDGATYVRAANEGHGS